MMTETEKFINDLREDKIRRLHDIAFAKPLIEGCQLMTENIGGYHGREILELLQNADDAYQKSIDNGQKPAEDLEVVISFRDNVLSVSNSGTCFSKEGIQAIVNGNESTKRNGAIGNKGTGFRSLLNWAEEVRILSGDFNVEFSKEIADKKFAEIKTHPAIAKQISEKKGLYLPMLFVPQNMAEKRAEPNKTIIEVKIKEDQTNKDKTKENKTENVLKQLEDIDLRILLFMPNIRKISIATEQKDITYECTVKTPVNQSGLKITDVVIKKTSIACGEIVEQKEEAYTLFCRDWERTIKFESGETDEKVEKLAIAVPDDYSKFDAGTLFCYFPILKEEAPFNCVAHASYALDPSRNTINDNDDNADLLKKQIELLFEVAQTYIDKGDLTTAYWLLVPRNTSKLLEASRLNKKDFYLNMLKTTPMFLTVNGKLLRAVDGPKMLPDDFPATLKGEPFAKLLTPLPEETGIENLLQELAEENLNYSEEEAALCIDAISDEWNVQQKVEVFIWWNKYYQTSLPKLLMTQNDGYLAAQQRCFFLDGNFDDNIIPEWTKLTALTDEYQKELFAQTKASERYRIAWENDDLKNKTPSRLIPHHHEWYPTVQFQPRDISTIIPDINNAVNSYETAVEFVKWLWNKARTAKKEKSENGNEKIIYNFPHCGGGYDDSDNLYLGKRYGNELGENLFDKEVYKEFPRFEEFGIEENQREEFIRFLGLYGVKKYPPLKVQEVKDMDLILKLQAAISEQNDGHRVAERKFEVTYIKGLEEILNSTSTKEIINWLHSDSELRQYLEKPTDFAAKIQYKLHYSREREMRQYIGNVDNYVREIFNRTAWIKIGNKTYAPRQVLNYADAIRAPKFALQLPVITQNYVTQLAQELTISVDELKKILGLFGFCKKITDLSSSDFYGFLLRLPEVENYAEIYKAIYRIVESTDFNREFDYSKNKEDYFKKGLLLVRQNGETKLVPAKEAYTPSMQIINKSKYPIVDKGLRTKNKNFKPVFGCNEYEKEYSIAPNSIVVSPDNEEFQKYFEEFLPYARAFKHRNDNIANSAQNLQIVLVKEIGVHKENRYEMVSGNYECLHDKSLRPYYITLADERMDIYKISEVIEDIYAKIAHSDGFEAGKLGELFREPSIEGRNFLIKKEFNDLNVLNDIEHINNIKKQFDRAVARIKPEGNPENFGMDDYKDLSQGAPATATAEKLIGLFRELGCDVGEFCAAGFEGSLDLAPYFREKLRRFTNAEKENFKNALFMRAQKDEALREDFLDKYCKFENLQLTKYNGSAYFDVEQMTVEEFGFDWREETNLPDANAEYDANYSVMNPDKLFEDAICNDWQAQRFIYFHEDDKFAEWLQQQQEKSDKEALAENANDDYEKYAGITAQEEEITNSERGSRRTSQHESGGFARGSYTEEQDEKSQKAMKRIGNIGELIIYNTLCKKYGPKNVKMRSEAFVKMGMLKPGQAKSGDYDLSYTDEDGKEYFVEVKTGDSNSFYMSEKELDFAASHREQYQLFLVYDVKTDAPKFHKLPTGFWESYEKEPIIKSIMFKF